MIGARRGLAPHAARRLRSAEVELWTDDGQHHRGVVLSATDTSLWLITAASDVFVALVDVAEVQHRPTPAA